MAYVVVDGVAMNVSEEILQKIKEEHEKNKKTNYSRVDEGEKYYLITENGNVMYNVEKNSEIDNDFYESGNYFKSANTAEIEHKRTKLRLLLSRFSEENNGSLIDMEDSTAKYYIVCSSDDGCPYIETAYDDISSLEVYFYSEKIAESALNKYKDLIFCCSY